MIPEDKPRRKSGFHAEQLEDEVVLYHPSGNQILQLNQTAYLIWQLCNGERTLAAILELLQQAYPEAAGEIAADVPETLQDWLASGCIELT
jgi:coenzyme PQQ biosynthesis protein PqqD